MGKIDGIGIEMTMSEFLFLEHFLYCATTYKEKPLNPDLKGYLLSISQELSNLKAGIESYGYKGKEVLIRIVPD